MFTFLSQFFLGDPPQPRDFDIGAIYHSPNLYAFFMFGLVLLCMCAAPAVLALWKSKRQGLAVGLGLAIAIGGAIATGGVDASGYSEGRYPGLQGVPTKKAAAATASAKP